MDFTDTQVTRIKTALTTYALTRGATEADLRLSRVRLGERTGLTEHVARVERPLRRAYETLSVNTQDVLEAARATAGALADTVPFHEFNDLDRAVWAVVQGAR